MEYVGWLYVGRGGVEFDFVRREFYSPSMLPPCVLTKHEKTFARRGDMRTFMRGLLDSVNSRTTHACAGEARS